MIAEAKRQGVCEEWHREMLRKPSVERLCKMYFKGDDWAMEHDFPSAEMLRHFKGQTEAFGLFVDAQEDLPVRPYVALFGKSNVALRYGGYSVSHLIIRHESHAHVQAQGNAIVFVTLMDKATLSPTIEDQATIKIFDKRDERSVV